MCLALYPSYFCFARLDKAASPWAASGRAPRAAAAPHRSGGWAGPDRRDHERTVMEDEEGAAHITRATTHRVDRLQ